MRGKKIVGALMNELIRIARPSLEKPLLRGVMQHLFNYGDGMQVPFVNNDHERRFLILRNEYYCENPDLDGSIEKFMLDGTLASAHLVAFDTFYWDTDFTMFPHGDWKLLAKCHDFRPDAIVLSTYSPRNHMQASVETIRILRKNWDIPIIAIWWDTCWNGFWESIQPVLPFIDVHVVPENPLLTFLGGNNSSPYRKRFLPLWSPLDPSIYNNPGWSRDINVSFLGQVGGYRSNRMPYIQHLMENNVPIYCSLFNRAQQPPHSKYVEVLRRSKIGLNFSDSLDTHQLKARVFETMLCGAMLMESENPQTRCYFEPMKDYVSFDSKEDLVDKIRYYLEHEQQRAEIAARGELKVRQCYNHVEFWKRVMSKLEEVKGLPL